MKLTGQLRKVKDPGEGALPLAQKIGNFCLPKGGGDVKFKKKSRAQTPSPPPCWATETKFVLATPPPPPPHAHLANRLNILPLPRRRLDPHLAQGSSPLGEGGGGGQGNFASHIKDGYSYKDR